MTDVFEEVKRAIAKVSLGGIDKTGTAFYIGGRFALTALHVVAETEEALPRFHPAIQLRYPNTQNSFDAKVVQEFWSMEGDWAVLECEPPPSAAAIEFRANVERDDQWLCHGYPEIQIDGMTIGGKVRDPQAHQLDRPDAGYLLQLLSEEASAGMGAPLHGLSGAPCLVDGQAVGIMRSTLIKNLTDGELARHVFTQAGTAYATPCAQVIQWQVDRRLATLSGSWSPPQMVLEDFIVLLSSREGLPDAGDGGNERLALRDVAERAQKRLKPGSLSKPCYVYAAEVVATREALEQCVSALCRAKVVVLDASGFEPAIMFLAGIRAVCRRGVTLLSVGGNYSLGEELSVPFDIRDANIVVHSLRQNDSPIGDSVSLLAERIRRGLKERDSPQYLDLPVYDAIRLLPSDRRGIIADEEGVLVLCPFDPTHQVFWDKRLKRALVNELSTLRERKDLPAGSAVIGVARSFELNSPRLVTQALYEAIRRMQSCVTDLTDWSPNVLFELGVRLAASGQRSVCILDRSWDQELAGETAAQMRSLAALLVNENFLYEPTKPWEAQKVFGNAYGVETFPPPPLLRDGALHSLIEHELDIEMEPASRPVYSELLSQAALFSRSAGSGGRSKPVGLFPGNSKLIEREEEAEFERLVAVWLYLAHRYDRKSLLAQDTLCKTLDEVITTLFERHAGRLSERMTADLSELADSIENRSS